MDPTLSHSFTEFLHSQGILKKYFTVNIENTEMKMKVQTDKIVHILGSISAEGANELAPPFCLKCGKRAETDKVQESLAQGKVYKCKSEVKSSSLGLSLQASFAKSLSPKAGSFKEPKLSKQINGVPTTPIFGIQVPVNMIVEKHS
jgi:NAD-dependent SIR2 family protein deacetylase